ncbi:hypothetical protein C2845_PM03G33830 [Panicum miliaceum]|uniref:Protein FAR1-RELATED SEQUENCE n=1 Tax=Panicum miliaceum TaxID=4540 RepID=A0A3L6TE61_PANMI|nr:hypothetical protein C2845_PM03G33830 [Panicum miliaceum]
MASFGWPFREAVGGLRGQVPEVGSEGGHQEQQLWKQSMSAHTQTLEELAEYEYIVERTFLSEDNGYEFFNAFARNKGFSLRKGKVTRATNKDDISNRQKLIYMRNTPETFEYQWKSFLKKIDGIGKCRRRPRDGTKVFEVECDDEETLGNVSCSCLKFECKGIPCCHIMVVLIRLGAMMPQCCVLNRWTLNAKSGSCLETGDRVNSMKGTRFSELLMLAKPIFEEASCSIDEYLRWKEILEHEHKEKIKREDIDGESRTNEDQDNNLEAEASPINVQDPKIVQSKGAPKRFKNFLDRPIKRRCSECN